MATSSTNPSLAGGVGSEPFQGPIHGARLNPAAHGNVCIVATCRCGAARRSNVNQRHAERGPWVSLTGEE
jgi:hypothetical protein